MFTKVLLPVLAAAGLGFAVYAVVQAKQTPPPYRPEVPPPTAPGFTAVAGPGIVEARLENIPIGVTTPGVVREVFVKKGDFVEQGQPLFRVDDTELRAQLRVKQAELLSAEAQLRKLLAGPRPEDVPPAEAAVAEAKAKLNDAEAAMGRTEKLYNRQMAPASDFDRDRFAYYAARATASRAQADLERIKRIGKWKEENAVYEASVEMARAEIEGIKDRLKLCTVTAPMSGHVLQINVRLGQFAALAWREPMIVLGDKVKLNVRVDIDEIDVPRFDASAPAVATLKGNSQVRIPLKPSYVEPYVIPKQSLTGSNSERVDTRVLQAVYELPDERPFDLYVGQQMDVYIEAKGAKGAKATAGVARTGKAGG